MTIADAFKIFLGEAPRGAVGAWPIPLSESELPHTIFCERLPLVWQGAKKRAKTSYL